MQPHLRQLRKFSPAGHPLRAALTLMFTVQMLLSACNLANAPLSGADATRAAEAALNSSPTPEVATPTPFPIRPRYSPGELVDYVAQPGDTLPVLALRFNTSVREILDANSFIPASATTMPPGMPMKIPIYYLPLWGPHYQIIPDSLFVNGPTQIGFDTYGFVNGHPGWLKDQIAYSGWGNLRGGQIVEDVARNYSVSPRLLLALLEYQAGALSNPDPPDELRSYTLGFLSWDNKGIYNQLNWAANLLNNGYYGSRNGKLLSIEYPDGRLERLDPWINASTASLHNYFNTIFTGDEYLKAISADGFAQTYASLFGDPWAADQPHIPGSLVQPEFILPFQPGHVWAFTGGPHTGWGEGEPYAAIDFAPPAVSGGCVSTQTFATAMASGLVVRSSSGEVMIDLDGDGDERTGWIIFYLHLATADRIPLGAFVERGQPLGHPSCEGGISTGTHVHISRKYNGEWINAEGMAGVLALTMEGWVVKNGSQPYLGTLTRNAETVTACTCSNASSFIQTALRGQQAIGGESPISVQNQP